MLYERINTLIQGKVSDMSIACSEDVLDKHDFVKPTIIIVIIIIKVIRVSMHVGSSRHSCL